jgi:DNA-binding FadR family transcriptional regulator
MLGTSPDALEHLKQARLMFERAMVTIAAQKATEADIAELRSAHDALAAAPSGSREFIDADMRFHKTIAGISGNPFFSAVSRAMLDCLTHFAIREVHQPGAERLSLSEHEQILACISNRDETGAAQAIEDHLLRANEIYRKLSASVSRGD